MKRIGSKVLKPKKKQRTEVESEEEEDRLSRSESEPSIEDDDLDVDSADQSEGEDQRKHAIDDEEDCEQDLDEENDAEKSDDEQQETDEDNNDENEDGSEQDKSGNEDDDTGKHTPSKKQNIVQGKVHRVTPLLKKKKRKAGVIYICSIPKHMNVSILRSLLEPFGEIGRIYLQPTLKDGKVKMKTAHGKRAMIQYTEGWVEFLDKRAAKAVVPLLNMHPITNKKKSVFRDILWSMKYLSGFQWIHLNERLAYERAVAKEKMREQIQQIRKEVSYHETKVHHKEMAIKNAAREKKEKRAKNGEI